MNKKRSYILKIRSFLLKKFLWLTGIIGLVFWGSCSKFDGGNPQAMYGVLFPEIKFRGSVTDQENQNPVHGISVKLTEGIRDTASAVTDSLGNYFIFTYGSYENQTFKLIFTDVDSTNNGEYLTKTIDVSLSFRDMNNKEHIANVKLEPKE